MVRTPRLVIIVGLLLLGLVKHSSAATVTVAWDPNPEPNVRYVVFWGTQHLAYTSSAAAGTGTSYAVSGLVGGQTYYFAVQATTVEGLTSPFSDEVSFTVPGTASAGDFTGDGQADTGTFRCATGEWSVSGMPPLILGRCGDKPVPADYDGDSRTDIAVWRPSDGMWYVLLSSEAYSQGAMLSVQWGSGSVGDVPVPGDYDGDGKTDFAIYRPSAGAWWVLKSSGSYATYAHFAWGLEAAGDMPTPADFDGDGKVDPAFWRPATGTWWVLRSGSAYRDFASIQWGSRAAGDVPLPADYDGDNKADPAVWRPSSGTWWVLRSSDSYTRHTAKQWGVQAAGDIPVPRDYDGDGQADFAVWRPASGTWWILNSSAGYATYSAQTGATQVAGSAPVQTVAQ